MFMRKIVIVFLFLMIQNAICREYPRGAIVGIHVRGISADYKPIQEFKSWLVERMRVFAEEKKDFTVFTPAVYDSGAIPGGMTHLFIIGIDSVTLVPYKKYQESVEKSNKTMEGIGHSPLPYVFNEQQSKAMRSLFTNIAYGSNDHPEMSVYLEIREIKSGKDTWNYKKNLDVESNTVMGEEEQLAQLLAQLKTLVIDEAGFLKI
jgi:hypothetical protein